MKIFKFYYSYNFHCCQIVPYIPNRLGLNTHLSTLFFIYKIKHNIFKTLKWIFFKNVVRGKYEARSYLFKWLPLHEFTLMKNLFAV